VALGVPESIRKKISQDGLKSLSDEEKARYLADPDGFLALVRDPGFQRYTDKLILPSFQSASRLGVVSGSVTTETFFATRIFEDEALACSIARNSRSDETMIVLLDAERVKFGFGVEERLRRNLRFRLQANASAKVSALEPDRATSIIEFQGKESPPLPLPKALEQASVDVISVLLNPTAEDSLSPTAQLQLVLGYGPFLKDQRPLAEYLWFSNYPPVKILTRPKNPISAEGEKPPGESSIIGAF
jgi:hypothetical protein